MCWIIHNPNIDFLLCCYLICVCVVILLGVCVGMQVSHYMYCVCGRIIRSVGREGRMSKEQA